MKRVLRPGGTALILLEFGKVQEGEKRFNYRVVGIALDGDRALLHRAEKDDFSSLPGGRVELLESSQDTLIREMREELGVEIHVL